MGRVYVTVGTRYLRNAQVFLICQILVDERLIVENQSFGGQFMLTRAELVTAWEQGEIQFEVPTGLARTSPHHRVATEYTIADFQHLPEHLRDEARRRYELLLPILKRPPSQRTRPYLIAYAATLAKDTLPTAQDAAAQVKPTRGELGQAVSWASLERWLTAFIESGYDLRSLVPAVERSARKGEARLDRAVEQIVLAVLAECAASPHNRTARDVYLAIVNRIATENRTRPAELQLNLPGKATIYRRIHSAGIERILRRQRSRKEIQAAASVQDGPRPTRILQRVEIDHTVLDLYLVDEEDRLPIGRPTLTYALDVSSGFPLGVFVGFEPPSYRTVASCLLHGILPKGDVQTRYETANPWLAYGLPETLIVDNGKEFTGRDLEDACGQLGIILERMPVRTPWFKGAVERFFRTNNTGLIHSLPGTTFSNVLERGDYDVFQHACISLTAFWKLLHVFLLDVYAQDWHSGIDAIPSRRWQESIQAGFLPAFHTSAEETRILLMRTDERVVQRAGIEFEGLFYRSPDLARLRSVLPQDNQRVHFKYDPADIGMLYVSDPIEHRWLRVEAAEPTYARGLSLWKHRIIWRYTQAQKREVDIVALAAAKEHIRRIVAEEFALTRKSKGRKTAARFLDVGVPAASLAAPSPAEPPALPAAKADTALPKPDAAATTQHAPAPEHDQAANSSSTKRNTKQRKTPAPSADAQAPLQRASADDLNDLDLSGWGADYNLPPSSGGSQ
ncbi:MAG: hypothetical protein OHK0022_07140 [Roseiflexaceae bacterium]